MGPRPLGTELLFYTARPHPCAYLTDRDATMIVVDPEHPKDPELYGLLLANGFRRSGEQIYRPLCTSCQGCVPVRVPVRRFVPRRSQRRSWHRNLDLQVDVADGSISEEVFALYSSYINTRHAGGSMENPTPATFLDFLTSTWCDTRFFTFRHRGRLLAVAVVDRVHDALSAVYTFFDPGEVRRSLGVYTVLWTVEQARREGLDWLYLGYWIRDCRKMSYKREYQPQQQLRGRRWVNIDDRRPPLS